MQLEGFEFFFPQKGDLFTRHNPIRRVFPKSQKDKYSVTNKLKPKKKEVE